MGGTPSPRALTHPRVLGIGTVTPELSQVHPVRWTWAPYPLALPKVGPEPLPGPAWPALWSHAGGKALCSAILDMGSCPAGAGPHGALGPREAASQPVRCHPVRAVGPEGAAAFRSCLGKKHSTPPSWARPQSQHHNCSLQTLRWNTLLAATVRATWDEDTGAGGRPASLPMWSGTLQLCPEALGGSWEATV